MQIINEEHKEVNGKIAFFPVLDLDKEFAMRENSGSGVKKDICIGGQTLHKLPDFLNIPNSILKRWFFDS